MDGEALAAAVRRAKPDAVVHLMTAIPKQVDPKRLAADFAPTNRFAHRRHPQPRERRSQRGRDQDDQPRAGVRLPPDRRSVKQEDAPLWQDGPKQFRPVVEALIEHERLTREAGGVVLRFGHLYGPGSAFANDGSFIEQLRAGKVPVVGGGTAVFSFTHARDAATAIVAALDKDVTGPLNVVDDDPTPLREWLPIVAELVGAPPPKKAPAALARLAVGALPGPVPRGDRPGSAVTGCDDGPRGQCTQRDADTRVAGRVPALAGKLTQDRLGIAVRPRATVKIANLRRDRLVRFTQ